MNIACKVEITEKPLTEQTSYRLTRLITSAAFVNHGKKFSTPFNGIIDTGAPITVIPPSIWKTLKVSLLREAVLSGISQKPECGVFCYLGIVLIKILGLEGQHSPIFPCLAYLSKQDEVPFILGYEKCLEYFQLEVDILLKKATLIWNPPPKKNNG